MPSKKSESTSKKSEGGFSQFAQDGLKAHNKFRRIHGVPDLKLNKKLCDFAQNWANTCAKKQEMEHKPNNDYGENLFYFHSTNMSQLPTPHDAVQDWYDEIKLHKFGVEKINDATLHFTQLIWKTTTDLGMAISTNKKNESYVVAEYNPPGNWEGEFIACVPKAKK